MRKKINQLLLVMFASLFLFSCKPEEFDTDGLKIKTFRPEYAIPLVHSTLTVDDVNEDCIDYRVFDPNGFIRHIYLGSFKTVKAEEAIILNNQKFSQVLTLSDAQASALSGGTDQTVFTQVIKNVSIGAMEWDSLLLKAGTFAANINSEIKTSGTLKITVVDAQKNGNKLSLSIPFNYSNNLPVLASSNTSMASYHMDFTKGIQGFNDVNLSFELQLKGTSETVTSRDKMTIDFDWSGMQFAKFYGYTGDLSFKGSLDTMSLCILDNKLLGNYHFDYAFLKITSHNSFGAPTLAKFNRLSMYSDSLGEKKLNGFPDPIPVNVPAHSNIGMFESDSFTMNRDNSNFKDEVNKKPKKLLYQCQVDINPAGKQQRNHFADTSCFKLDLHVDLPMEGFGNDFIIDEEEDVSIDIPDDNTVENVMMRIIALNGLPVQLALQVYMVDSFDQVFDSMFVENNYLLLESAIIDARGRVQTPIQKVTEVEFDVNRALRLNRMKKVFIKARPRTFPGSGNDPSVLLYNTDFLDLKIGVNINLKIEHEE